MNLRPPPVTDDINVLYDWCFELWQFLQYPSFHAIRFVPRDTKSDRQEGDVFCDSNTDKLIFGGASSWETITSS